ncbi:BI1-like protein [Hevea brasiliensis]|uniref:BI1-like protein n=1 Tax=Hevea brasiliensis TaxID=3981 RepID=UPI0025F4D7FB|nr:BI1-like protein [Hevea brasiliensis]
MEGLPIGALCVVFDGKMVLQALGLIATAFSFLTGYTFWAARRGKDFSLHVAIIFFSLVILAAATVSLVNDQLSFFPHPFGPALPFLGGLFPTLLLVTSTGGFIKEFHYDQHLRAVEHVFLYVTIMFFHFMLYKYMKVMKDVTEKAQTEESSHNESICILSRNHIEELTSMAGTGL